MNYLHLNEVCCAEIAEKADVEDAQSVLKIHLAAKIHKKIEKRVQE